MASGHSHTINRSTSLQQTKRSSTTPISSLDTKRARIDTSLMSSLSSSSSSDHGGPNSSMTMPSLERTPSTGSSSSSSSAAGGKKKLVIKSFKVPPKPPASFEETTFAKLSAAVTVRMTLVNQSASQSV
jgi:hypothetical protein